MVYFSKLMSECAGCAAFYCGKTVSNLVCGLALSHLVAIRLNMNYM